MTSGRSHKGYDFDDATGAIIGACIDVHKSLGPGFREITYQRALALELEAAGLEYSGEQKSSYLLQSWAATFSFTARWIKNASTSAASISAGWRTSWKTI